MSYNDLSKQKTPDAAPLVTPVVKAEDATIAVDLPETATAVAEPAETALADKA